MATPVPSVSKLRHNWEEFAPGQGDSVRGEEASND